MTNFACVLTAMAQEAGALMGRGEWNPERGHFHRTVAVNHNTRLLYVRSGLGVENARAASSWAITQGVSSIIVLGVSGGIKPGLRPGNVIVADSVIQEDREWGTFSWKTHSTAALRTESFLSEQGLACRRGSVLTETKAGFSAETKMDLFKRTHALAVDMESAGAARAATEARIPIFVLRTVCDPAEQSIPEGFFDWVNERGEIRWRVLINKLQRKPSMLPALCSTAKSYALALSSLRKAWRLLLQSDLPKMLTSP